MKEFGELSGPWIGMSIQEGFRLSEKITLHISGLTFHGQGTDVDGDFNLSGTFDPGSQIVTIVRRYTRSPRNPSQEGYPFDYLGRWDGQMVSGRWCMRTHPEDGGPFEMWPEREQDIEERQIQLESESAEMPIPVGRP